MNTAVHPVLKDITEVESTEKNGKASQRHGIGFMQETNRILQCGKKVNKCKREITGSIVLIGLLEECNWNDLLLLTSFNVGDLTQACTCKNTVSSFRNKIYKWDHKSVLIFFPTGGHISRN